MEYAVSGALTNPGRKDASRNDVCHTLTRSITYPASCQFNGQACRFGFGIRAPVLEQMAYLTAPPNSTDLGHQRHSKRG